MHLAILTQIEDLTAIGYITLTYHKVQSANWCTHITVITVITERQRENETSVYQGQSGQMQFLFSLVLHPVTHVLAIMCMYVRECMPVITIILVVINQVD